MNKTAIKNFAIWARNKLIADIQYRAGLMGITADGIKAPMPQSTGTMEFYDIGISEPYAISGEAIAQRKELVETIRKKERDSNYAIAYKYILEEVAYTWFNRLIAIRFMEVNDYLPAHIRVLSSESGKNEPDLVTTPFDAELIFTSDEKETVLRLKNENKLDELFRLLFIKQCNALNEILPALFEKTSDYTELLLNLSVVDQEGVVYHLTHDIPEQDFDITHPDEDGKIQGQVEIIGWLYQYYNTEPKNAAFAKKGKITKEEIPAVTQLFTPDWIVRYMVENSLGRIFIDKRKEQGVFADGRDLGEMSWDEVEAKRIANEEEIAGQMGWKYYLPEAAQTKEVRRQLDELQKQSEYKDVRDIKVIDPCMGSGHILVYAFDMLMQMYESNGYSRRDAAQCILEHNLYGLDIDERAAQLAYFAVMMKARQYDRKFLSRGVQPHVRAIQESNETGGSYKLAMGDFLLSKEHQETLNYLLEAFIDAKEYGSVLCLEKRDYQGLREAWKYTASQTAGDINLTLWHNAVKHTVAALIEQAILLTQEYDVVVTNPPYMGNLPTKITEYVITNYPDSRYDLYSVFIEKCMEFTSQNGYVAMITQHTWMFISSFAGLRRKMLRCNLCNLVHLGTKAFETIGGEVVQTVAFIFRKSGVSDYSSIGSRLVDYEMSEAKEIAYLNHKNEYAFRSNNFELLPGTPCVYWLSDKYYLPFDSAHTIEHYVERKAGVVTGNDPYFVRLWHEPLFPDISLSPRKDYAKYHIMQKGGGFSRYYGNNGYVLRLADLYKPEKTNVSVRRGDADYYFKKAIGWSQVGNSEKSFRFVQNSVCGTATPTIYLKDDKLFEYILAFLNTKVAFEYLTAYNPTINLLTTDICNIPLLICAPKLDVIREIVKENITNAQIDWDSYETSWDFQQHPLLRPIAYLANAYATRKTECEQRFLQLKANEEELNRIFIDIYGLQDELTPDVADKDVTVHRIFDAKDDVPESMQGSSYVRTKRDEVVSLISYAVGCMFGRYSLDVDGLAYAGGDWDTDKYKTFLPDLDGILPITDAEYLEDDIVSRLCGWLKAVYGADTLEENLDFIAGALGGSGNSSREIIRSYFLKDFFKDHCKTYQKRPIYWQFDSGKQNGFKALIYLHRYTPDTIGNLRVDYLHKMQRVYESEINRMQDMIDHSANAREMAAATKRKEKLQKQLKECRDYDEMIAHLALSRIELDLDDGVKVNYEKIQTASDGKKYAVLAKI